jgi:23S rRNA (adenine-N6)-dimethyltransferase
VIVGQRNSLDPHLVATLHWVDDLRHHSASPWVGHAARGVGIDSIPRSPASSPLTRTCRVVAIEANRGRAARLGDLVGDRVKVVRVDAEEMYLPRRPFHVVANPPYSITSCLVPLLLQPGSRLVRAHLVLQRQAAARWCDAVNSTPRRARRFDAHLGRRIARRSFDPPPKVDSRVLVIERRSRRH